MFRSIKTVLVVATLFLVISIGYIDYRDSGYVQVCNLSVRELYLSEDKTINNVVYHKNQLMYSALDFYKYSVVNTGYGESFLLESKYLKPIQSSIGIQNIISPSIESLNIAVLPVNVQDSLNKNGWSIEVTDEDLTSNYGLKTNAKHVMGVTVYKDKVIKLKNDPNLMQYVICHEVGHYLDKSCNSNGYLSETEQWLRIYEKEKDKSKFLSSDKDYAISTPKEYFAECINQTLLFPELISKNMPLSYYYCLACLHSI